MRVGIALQELKGVIYARKVPIEKQRLAFCREQRQTHRGGEGDVHLPQVRSDWEKEGQSWCAGVSVSVTMIDPTGASGLRWFLDVSFPAKVAQCHKSVTEQEYDIVPPFLQELTAISCLPALLIEIFSRCSQTSIKNVHVHVETYTDNRTVFITLLGYYTLLMGKLFS